MAGEVLYRKVGRRYKPVGVSELPCLYNVGAYVVVVDDCCRTTHRIVEPALGEVESALLLLRDELSRQIIEASRSRHGGRIETTPLERHAYKAYAAIVGEGATLTMTIPAASDVATNVIEWLRKKMQETNPPLPVGRCSPW